MRVCAFTNARVATSLTIRREAVHLFNCEWPVCGTRNTHSIPSANVRRIYQLRSSEDGLVVLSQLQDCPRSLDARARRAVRENEAKWKMLCLFGSMSEDVALVVA